jgi:hypothetical protein
MTSILLVSGSNMPNINSFFSGTIDTSSIVDRQLNFTYDSSGGLPIIISSIVTATTTQINTTLIDYSNYFPDASGYASSIELLFTNPLFYTTLVPPLTVIYNNITYIVNRVMNIDSNIIMLMVPI